jgi:uncharacterized protein YraI
MKLVRLACCTGTLFMFSAVAASATPAYVLSNVNLRSGPDTGKDIVTRIPEGAVVDANNCTNGWCEVTWQDKSGFAIQTALDTSGKPHVRSAPPPGYAGGPGGPGYVEGPPIVAGPPVYGGPVYYGYGPYYGPRWGWRRW